MSAPDPTSPTPTEMVTALIRLRSALEAVPLPLDVPDAEGSRVIRSEMVDQIEDYVLPRLIQIDAPLLTVVGGSTGAGKSTLVNSLVGATVTETGVLRPTTRSPVLVHNPADADWFDKQRILPGLARTTGATGDPGALQLVSTDTVPEGLAILDAPDIDSVEERNRTLAAELLAAADLWLFVTSAARYADQVPWDFLKAAAERSTAVAVVLDRTPPEATEEVAGHLARMLTARGLRDSPLFIVAESPLDETGMLEPGATGEIGTWLRELAADSTARDAVVRQTLDGAVRSLSRRAYVVADAAADQAAMAARLRKDVDDAYDRALARVDEASADGTMLRGEVLARWQEFVGTGELLRSLETRVGRVRDRVVAWAKGKPRQAERVTVAVESGLENLILESAESAAERASASWGSVTAGAHLLEDSGRDLGRASRDFRARAERAVRDWQHGVLEMVRTEGADRRTTARFLAYGVNGLSVALMVVVFASTAAIPTGAEVGVASGGALIGQKLLEAVFGDQAVRRLAAAARKDLSRRVGELLDAERERYRAVLDEVGLGGDGGGRPGGDGAERLREVARRIDDLRFAERNGLGLGRGDAGRPGGEGPLEDLEGHR
ncbi:MAG TPA: GTPase domain-containing protein [Nocardioidaceae bacterium]|nr:GTPase domain-containing protein [Nocardioidaceae bacterium]